MNEPLLFSSELIIKLPLFEISLFMVRDLPVLIFKEALVSIVKLLIVTEWFNIGAVATLLIITLSVAIGGVVFKFQLEPVDQSELVTPVQVKVLGQFSLKLAVSSIFVQLVVLHSASSTCIQVNLGYLSR